MRAFDDFARGIRGSFARPSLAALGWMYLIASAVTALFAVAAFLVVRKSAEGSAMAFELRQGITADWLLDVAGRPGLASALLGLSALGALLVLVYLTLAVVTAGGVVSGVARAVGGAQASPADSFWEASLRHAGVMARVALLEIVVIAAAIAALAALRVAGGAVDLRNGFRWSWLVGGVVALALVTTLFDLARIRAVLLGERSAIGVVSRSARLMLACAPSVLVVTTCHALLAFVTTGVVLWVHAGLGKSTLMGVVVAAVVGQISVVIRLWCRLASYGTEVSLWSRCRPPE